MRPIALSIAVLLAAGSVKAEPAAGSLELKWQPVKRSKAVLICGGLSILAGGIAMGVGTMMALTPARGYFDYQRGGAIAGLFSGGGSFALMGILMVTIEMIRFRHFMAPAPDPDLLREAAIPTMKSKPLQMPVAVMLDLANL